MTFVVTEACIKCKFNDCVEICPVNCFYEGKSMLVIHPIECIDCGACEPVCPASAIVQGNTPEAEPWIELNEKYSAIWPNITQKRDALEDAEQFKGEEKKYEKYFSPKPAVPDG